MSDMCCSVCSAQFELSQNKQPVVPGACRLGCAREKHGALCPACVPTTCVCSRPLATPKPDLATLQRIDGRANDDMFAFLERVGLNGAKSLELSSGGDISLIQRIDRKGDDAKAQLWRGICQGDEVIASFCFNVILSFC